MRPCSSRVPPRQGTRLLRARALRALAPETSSAPGLGAARSRPGPGRCAWCAACRRTPWMGLRDALHAPAPSEEPERQRRRLLHQAEHRPQRQRREVLGAPDGGQERQRMPASAAARRVGALGAVHRRARIGSGCAFDDAGRPGGRAERQRSPMEAPRPASRKPRRGCAVPRSLSASCPFCGDSCPLSARSVAAAVRIMAQPGKGLSVICPVCGRFVAFSVRFLSRPK